MFKVVKELFISIPSEVFLIIALTSAVAMALLMLN